MKRFLFFTVVALLAIWLCCRGLVRRNREPTKSSRLPSTGRPLAIPSSTSTMTITDRTGVTKSASSRQSRRRPPKAPEPTSSSSNLPTSMAPSS